MLIGLRFLLMFAVIAISASFLAYLFTKQPRFLAFTKTILKITIGVAVAVAVIYVVERAIL